MLSVLLGAAFFSRQMWGWISDRIGGLMTVLIGSVWQFFAVVAFALTQDEIGLFTVSAIFGLGFSGIIPAYVLIARELFPAREAGWRVPVLLCLQRFRHGVGRLVRRAAVRSFRLLCAGVRGGADLQRGESAADRHAGGTPLAARVGCGPRSPTGRRMPTRLDDVRSITPRDDRLGDADGRDAGEGFTEITRDVAAFLHQAGAQDGVLLAYIRHTSASLVIQENADPDVQTDLVTALGRLAPANAGWVHDTEGPDDMPAHIKAMLNGISLHVPVTGGKLALGTWQGIYLAEHRARPHRREVLLQFIGSKRAER